MNSVENYESFSSRIPTRYSYARPPGCDKWYQQHITEFSLSNVMYRLHKEDTLPGTDTVVLRPRQHEIYKCTFSGDGNVWDNKAFPMPGGCPANQLTETESRPKGLWKEKRNTTSDRCTADAYGFLYSVFNAEVVRLEVGLPVFFKGRFPFCESSPDWTTGTSLTQSRQSQQNCYGPQGTWEKNSIIMVLNKIAQKPVHGTTIVPHDGQQSSMMNEKHVQKKTRSWSSHRFAHAPKFPTCSKNCSSHCKWLRARAIPSHRLRCYLTSARV